MSGGNTITIGGVTYDAMTGLPTKAADAPLAPAEVKKEVRRNAALHSSGVHKRQSRSQTLNRSFVKKKSTGNRTHAPSPAVRRGGSMDMKRVRPQAQRSPMIKKFATEAQSHHVAAPVASSKDIAPSVHPVVARAAAKSPRITQAHSEVKPHAPTPKPAQEIKNAAIKTALENAKDAPAHKRTKSANGRKLSVASACLGLLLLAGYFTYLNMPNLSVKVAASQAGINAAYPEYHPVGYRLNGPVAFSDGQVSMKFASNSGPQNFSLNQSRSSWDSSALLENYVDPKSDGRYATYSDAGLTIYTYGNNAAWVNGGILYTVEGTATLSGDQVRRMATSL